MRLKACALITALSLLGGLASGVILAQAASAQVPGLPSVPGVPGVPGAPGLPALPALPALPNPPAPPEQLMPALAILSPITSTGCGMFGLAIVLTVLVGGAAGVPAGSVFPVLIPVLVACGNLPLPATRTTCDLDKQMAAQGAMVMSQLGQSLPVPFPSTVGKVVDMAYGVDAAAAGQGAPSPGLGSALAGALSCEVVHQDS